MTMLSEVINEIREQEFQDKQRVADAIRVAANGMDVDTVAQVQSWGQEYVHITVGPRKCVIRARPNGSYSLSEVDGWESNVQVALTETECTDLKGLYRAIYDLSRKPRERESQ